MVQQIIFQDDPGQNCFKTYTYCHKTSLTLILFQETSNNNPQPPNDAYRRFSALFQLYPFLGEFLLLLEINFKFVEFCTKFQVKQTRRGWIERFGILIAIFFTRGYYLQYSNSLGDKESIIDSTFIPCPCLGKVGIDQNRKVSLIHWVLDAD